MEAQMRSATQMVNMIAADSALQERIKADPIPALKEAAIIAEAYTYQGDRKIYRVAIYVLGLLALISSIGSIILISVGRPIPEVLVALGSAAVGALVGLFAPPPQSNK